MVYPAESEKVAPSGSPRRAGLGKKKATIAGGSEIGGGEDGTRTRDPRGFKRA